MTREEAVRPFKMLSANWSFLDFTSDTTFEIWFDALEPYHEAEVRQGVKDAIANITKTPTVADVLEFVRAVRDGSRRAAAEADWNRPETAAVGCWDCNDFGFVNIIYPTGYETIRRCNCRKADEVFGARPEQEGDPKWREEMLFGKNEIPSQYKLIRVRRIQVSTGEKWQGNDCMKWGYVPYTPFSQEKEEVYFMYQKRSRK